VQIDWNGFKVNEENIPLSRPGVYTIQNLVNGKFYVGEAIDVANRLRSHAAIVRAPRKFRNALRKYGLSNFIAIPIWYSVVAEEDKFFQLAVEADLIATFNSVNNGYNVLANYHQGLYGPAWSAYLQTFWTAELRLAQAEITRLQFTDPARRALQSEAVAAYNNRPEVKQKFMVLQQRLWADPNYKPDRSWHREFFKSEGLQAKGREARMRPEVIEKRNVSIKETWQSPELREQQAAAGQRKMAAKRETDPEAFQKHMNAFTQAGTEAAATRITGSRWINNGTTNKRLSTSDPLPEGWSYGRVGFVKTRRP
jgi:hypothetical protein